MRDGAEGFGRQRLLPVQAGQAQHRVVDPRLLVPGMGGPAHAERQGIQDEPQLGLALGQFLLGQLALGDVKLQRHAPGPVSGFVLQGAELQFDPDLGAGFGVVEDLALERPPTGHGLVNRADRARIRLGAAQQDAGALAPDLVEGVAEKAGEAFVHPFDAARGIGQDHAVGRPARHQRQAARLRLGLP